MPRGGARPGAGRPRKSAEAQPRTKHSIAACAAKADQTPLQFMLSVMNDAEQDLKFRAQMAQAAAPYVHGKPGDEKQGKKAAQQEKANEIGRRFAPIGPPTLKAVK